jgi:hypothetical protein
LFWISRLSGTLRPDIGVSTDFPGKGGEEVLGVSRGWLAPLQVPAKFPSLPHCWGLGDRASSDFLLNCGLGHGGGLMFPNRRHAEME